MYWEQGQEKERGRGRKPRDMHYVRVCQQSETRQDTVPLLVICSSRLGGYRRQGAQSIVGVFMSVLEY